MSRPNPRRLFKRPPGAGERHPPEPSRMRIGGVEVTESEAAEWLKAFVDSVKAGTHPCRLCSRPAVAISAWVPGPEDKAKMGPRPGTFLRVMPYALCERHAAQPPEVTMPAVERAFLSEAAVVFGNPEAN